ncbi:MAG: hypothetical protein JXA42_07365 [Anaerolineales bacterium]|nr:hypothetical protein [Anaerolineales bacterium]
MKSLRVYQDQLSVLLAGTALGLTLSRIIQLPTRQVGLPVFGTQLGVELSVHWLINSFIVGLVITGVNSLLVSHPLVAAGSQRRVLIFWILPALTALILGIGLGQIEDIQTWLLVLVGGLIAVGVVANNAYRSMDPEESARPPVQLLVTITVYGLAMAYCLVIYGSRTRFLLSGSAILVVSGLLAARLLWGTGQPPRRVLLYSAIVSLIMAQAIWALNYWAIAPLYGGLVLLILFYLATAIAQQTLQDRLDRRALIEVGGVALLAIIIIGVLV